MIRYRKFYHVNEQREDKMKQEIDNNYHQIKKILYRLQGGNRKDKIGPDLQHLADKV